MFSFRFSSSKIRSFCTQFYSHSTSNLQVIDIYCDAHCVEYCCFWRNLFVINYLEKNVFFLLLIFLDDGQGKNSSKWKALSSFQFQCKFHYWTCSMHTAFLFIFSPFSFLLITVHLIAFPFISLLFNFFSSNYYNFAVKVFLFLFIWLWVLDNA